MTNWSQAARVLEQASRDHDTRQAIAAARATIRERADSYASDARKFRDAGKLGRPIIGAEDDARWAACYQVIADELRKVAASVGQEGGRS